MNRGAIEGDIMGLTPAQLIKQGLLLQDCGSIEQISASLKHYVKGAKEIKIYPGSELEPPGPEEFYLFTKHGEETIDSFSISEIAMKQLKQTPKEEREAYLAFLQMVKKNNYGLFIDGLFNEEGKERGQPYLISEKIIIVKQSLKD